MKIGRHTAAFTLLEMLVVIGILAALLVAIVPAVNSLSKSGARKGAAGNILSVIEQARSLAIKDQRWAYVVFSTTFSSTSPDLIQKYAYRGYAVFEDDPNSSSDHSNASDPADAAVAKIQVTAWRTLPTGVSLRKDITANSPPWMTSKFAFSPEGSGRTENFPYLMFNPQGGLDSPDPTAGGTNPNVTTIALTIFEGVIKNGTELITSSKNTLGGPASIEQLTISRTSGRTERVPSPSPQP